MKVEKSYLQENARILRKNMTPEERHLWYDFLKNISATVYRQKVIGSYIVDFYCAQANLVIEIDGSQHYSADGKLYDGDRDDYLRSLGLVVLRYSNRDIHENFHAVCEDIYFHIVGRS